MLFQHTLTDKFDLFFYALIKKDRFSCDDFLVSFFLQDIYILLVQHFQRNSIFSLVFLLPQGFNFPLAKKENLGEDVMQLDN